MTPLTVEGTANQRAFLGWEARVSPKFPGAPAPVFSGTSDALFYQLPLIRLIGPHWEGGLPVFRERKFLFFLIPPDFSSAKASKNIHMIWPPTREINHQEELNKQKGF